jgi:hypothetical protein
VIYNLGIFTKSFLQFTDSTGKNITLVANLQSQKRAIGDQADGYDASEYQEVYEGNLVNPSTLPSTLEVGLVGTGTLNGVSGRVKLLNVFGASLAIAQSGFGQKIRVALIERTQFLDFGESS